MHLHIYARKRTNSFRIGNAPLLREYSANFANMADLASNAAASPFATA